MNDYGRFIGEVSLERSPGHGGGFVLSEPLVFLATRLGLRIEVAPGWETDGASIPRILWAWADPWNGPYLAAAVIHDALYRSHALCRQRADDVLLDGMRACRVRPSQAWAIWVGVRIGGWAAYDQVTKDQQLEYRRWVSISRLS